jgi:hypothetical protein
VSMGVGLGRVCGSDLLWELEEMGLCMARCARGGCEELPVPTGRDGIIAEETLTLSSE